MKSKIYLFSFLLLAVAALFQSCNDDETYADKRKRENKQIRSFLTSGAQVKSEDVEGEYLLNVAGNIKVISESEFERNDSTTDVSKNEYVYFKRTGIYMQILSKGDGKKLADGENARVVCRYIEFNIASDSIQSTNNLTSSTEMKPDVMIVNNTLGSFTGTFVSGQMYQTYNSSAVPAAWLKPLTYINLGRATDNLAHVRLIVPGSQGQANASANVYPCFYDITYQRGR